MPKHLILALLTMFFLSSCVTYQYFTVDSSQLPKDDRRSFVVDNDTMQLTYGFSGAGGDVTITVQNKTDQALFINWNKSALICNDQSYSLAQSNSAFVASANRTGNGTADLTGTVNVNPALEIIPGKTRISRAVLNLNITLPPVRMALPDTAAKQYIHFPDGGQLSYKTAIVDESKSPLKMKSYLTFVIGPGNGTEFVISNTFYIGQAIQTQYGPDRFNLYHQSGDQFYVWWQN